MARVKGIGSGGHNPMNEVENIVVGGERFLPPLSGLFMRLLWMSGLRREVDMYVLRTNLDVTLPHVHGPHRNYF